MQHAAIESKKVPQPSDLNNEPIKQPTLEICNGCRHIRYCVQFINYRLPWQLADEPAHRLVWRCLQCAPWSERKTLLDFAAKQARGSA